MNAKEYLSQAIWLDQIINNKLEQLESLKTLATKVNTNFNQERVSGGNNERSPMENAIVKIIDLEGEINRDIDRLVELKKEILETINQVSDISCQLILEMRYVAGKGWEEVADAMGYDRRTIFRIHGKALKEIEKLKVVTKCH